MKTGLRTFILMFSITAVASCKKDNVIDNSGQRPDLGQHPKPLPSAIIEVKNESTRETDEIDQVFLFTGEVIMSELPVKNDAKAQFTVTTMGTNKVNVIVKGPSSNSVVLVDGEGHKQCKNVTTSGITIVRFENVNIVADKKVSITYHSTPCK